MATGGDGIEVLSGLEAVRRRPAMYVGDTGNHGLLWLVRELLEVPRAPTKISMFINAADLTISAASVPPSVEPRKQSRVPFLVEACTTLHTNLDVQPTLGGLEILDDATNPATFVRVDAAPACLAIANALSKAFAVASISGGVCRRVEFARGALVAPLSASSTTAPDGMSLSFTPDPDIFQGISLRLSMLASLARDFAAVRGVAIEVRDEWSGRYFAA